MKNMFLSMMLCFFLMLAVPDKQANGSSLPDVGVIRTPDGIAPDTCYTLMRDGEPVSPLVQDMPVLNGDVIVPFEGKNVTLIYRHKDCPGKSITRRTVIKCDPEKLDTPGGFMNFLPDAMKKVITGSPKKSGTESWTRIGESEENRSCFPGDFRFSPWPPEGTTVLHGEPVFFRWTDPHDAVLPCSEARLIIAHSDEDAETPVVRDMKVGELLRVSAAFREGLLYNWHIEAENKKVSNVYHFSILGKKESDNIRSQMAVVGNKYADECPGLRQSLYLQIISEATPGLNLHADSFRLIREYKVCIREHRKDAEPDT